MTMKRIESGDGLGQFVKDPDKAKAKLAKTLIKGAKAWRESYGDIPFPSVATPVEKPALKTPETDLIGLAIAEYKSQSLTPELVNTTWQTIWSEWGARIGEKFEVPQCDRTSEELTQLQKENKGVLLVPDSVDLAMLGKIFPEMKSWAVQEGTTVRDEQSKGGCIDIEMDLESPHRDTNEDQINEFLKTQGRSGQRLKIDIIGSRFSKLLTGRYFDENTWSRLPGSRREGNVVGAYSHSDGDLDVHSRLGPQAHGPGVGFRSEGVRKA